MENSNTFDRSKILIAHGYTLVNEVYEIKKLPSTPQLQKKINDNLNEALNIFTQANGYLERQKVLCPERLILLFKIADIYREKKETDNLLKFYNLAIEIQKKLDPNNCNLPFYLSTISNIYNEIEEYDQALKFSFEALNLSKSLNPESLNLGIILANIAQIYEQKKNYRKAFKYFVESFKIRKRLNPNSLDHVNCLIAISRVLLKTNVEGRTTLMEALLLYFEAEVILKQNLSKSDLSPRLRTSFEEAISFVYNNIAVICEKIGDLKNAEHYFDQSLEKAKQINGNRYRYARLLNIAGNFFSNQGKTQKAIDLFIQGYDILEQHHLTKNPQHPDLISIAYKIADCANKMSEVFFKEKNTSDKAFVDYNDCALKYCDIVISKDPRFKYAYHLKGQILEKKDDSESLKLAIESFDQALRIDPFYIDAGLAKIKLLKKIAEKNIKNNDWESANQIAKEITNILANFPTQPSNFDDQYSKIKMEETKFEDFLIEKKIFIPENNFHFGSEKLAKEISKIQRKLTAMTKLLKASEKSGLTLSTKPEVMSTNASRLSREPQGQAKSS